MSKHHGRFVWSELMTSDTKGAQAFYGKVVGWGAKNADVPGVAYTLFTAGERQTAGLMTIPEDARKAGARPAWVGYVAVDDVDTIEGKIKERGGTLCHAPTDIPGVGRFAVATDPHGAVFAVIKGTTEAPDFPASDAPGETGWHELYAGDPASDFDFYSGLFGWKKTESFDMGPMGTYQLFAWNGKDTGGMMPKPATVPKPHWLYYFNVDAIDAAAGRVKANKGQVINGPMEVPGGQWIVQCVDPQGAQFALLAPKR